MSVFTDTAAFQVTAAHLGKLALLSLPRFALVVLAVSNVLETDAADRRRERHGTTHRSSSGFAL